MSLGDKKEIIEVMEPFPLHAQSLIILRSTFSGGAVIVNQVFNSEGTVIWTAGPNQTEAKSVLNTLKDFRLQRSVSLL